MSYDMFFRIARISHYQPVSPPYDRTDTDIDWSQFELSLTSCSYSYLVRRPEIISLKYTVQTQNANFRAKSYTPELMVETANVRIVYRTLQWKNDSEILKYHQNLVIS